MPTWLWRLRALLRRDRLLVEKQEELQFHFDQEVQAALRRGASMDEAVRHARMRAGLVDEGVESAREALGVRWLDGAATDLRHAARAVSHSRGFGTVAVLVLAASVAVTTLIFLMLDGIVLRPLPYAAPERLVRLYDATPRTPNFPVAIGRFLDFREQARSLERLALYTGQDLELSGASGSAGDAGAGGSRASGPGASGDERSQRLTGVAITSDFFAVLGRAPQLGRAFTEEDQRPGTRTAILGARLWRDRFQGDPRIIGRTIRLDRETWTVVGVAPEGFQHVGGDYRSPQQGETVDIWVPLAIGTNQDSLRGSHYCNAIARIKAGYSLTQAREELSRLAAAASARYPDYGTWDARLQPLLDEVTGRSRYVVWLLVSAGALVVLVSCANIAGLCVARAVARRREQALRRALGANRWQLLRIGLAENLIVGLTGAIAGLLLAAAGLPVLRSLLPADFPRVHEIALDARGALFAVAIGLVTVLAAGLVASWGERQAVAAPTRVTEGRESKRLRTLLVIGEVALAGLLCAGALFLLRSFQEIGARDHGFQASGALTFQMTIPRNHTPGDRARTYEALRDAIAAIPAVASVGASTNLPWSGYDENSSFRIVGQSAEAQRDMHDARYQGATAGYFDAAGMRLVRGRLFERTRDAFGQPRTLIVNDALARRYFPKGDAVGARLRVFGETREIVGVVTGLPDTPTDLDVKPALWFPLTQVEFPVAFFVVRTPNVEPTALTSAITQAVRSVDPELALADVQTLARRADRALAARRFALWLFQTFALLVLVLAAAGIYGLLAYIVRQRRKELGIRAALGASRRDLWTMVVRDGVRMAAIGAALCLALIPLAGSLLQTFLFNVRAFDPITITAAPAALLVIAGLASLGPARAAARSDASRALRED